MAGILNNLRKISQWIRVNPMKSIVTGLAFGSPVIDFGLKKLAHREMTSPVYNRLVRGSKDKSLNVGSFKHVIPRQDILDEMEKTIFSTSEPERFIVIIGPSGSGKTFAIKELCNKYPEGVVYTEISEPHAFVQDLSTELNMKVSPSSFLDLVLSYVSKKYTQYHVLPESQPKAINMVFRLLTEVSQKYKENFGKLPILIIDGVDLLAKHDPEVCTRLVTHAKLLANGGLLRVVLVSSEGSIMPMLDRLSAMNRALVFEVGDVTYENARTFLIQNGVAEDAARELVQCVGGRLVYLESGLKLIKLNGWCAEEVCENVKIELFERFLNAQQMVVHATYPESATILDAISRNGYISPSHLKCENIEKIKKAIQELVDANVLRHSKKGQITWYGKIQKDVFGKKSEE